MPGQDLRGSAGKGLDVGFSPILPSSVQFLDRNGGSSAKLPSWPLTERPVFHFDTLLPKHPYMTIATPAASASDAQAPFLLIDQLVKEFDGVRAVDAISVTINKGEIFALLGSSGCGKSDRKSTRLNSSHTVISYAV